ncbi:MAG: histidinol-phosphatase [Bacteroidota bacterium]|nr:histidinol-phosphatase [Bacteroidota bacterium]
MIYKTDYHIHSTFSDGKSLPEDYIAPAVKAGFREIGFSEHLTLFRGPLDWSMDGNEVGSYLAHVRHLRENTDGITIRIGLEVDFFPGKEAEIRQFLDTLELDYVIGSVHYLGESPVDMGAEFYEGKNINRIFGQYFEQVISAAASGIFDIIAHCDLVRIYGYAPSSNPEPLYREMAKSLRKHDVAFELNTNGRNRPIGDFYPDRRFLKIFRKENVPVCVNSDAHAPLNLGQYFDEAYDLLRDAGYTEMAVFDRRERYMIPF